MTTLVFVHGACVRDGAWWWHRMVAPLAARGIHSVAVALPSCGEAGPERGDLHDDAAAVRVAIEAVEGPVVLLGHSYGGMVITEAGAHERVEHLVYLTSVLPEAGESQGEIIGALPAPWMDPGEDDTVGVHASFFEDRFAQDCDAVAVEGGIARLTRQSLVPFGQAAAQIAWRTTPATYVVCTEDLATPADAQRARLKPGVGVAEIAAGHHPFLSRPDELAELLARVTDAS